jgi:hypothetical protein
MRDCNNQQQFEQHQEQEFGERNHLLLSMFPDIGKFKQYVHSSDISSKK